MDLGAEAPMLPVADSQPFTRTLAPLYNRNAIVNLTVSGFTVVAWNYDAAVIPPVINALVNAADGTKPVAPGGLVSIYGSALNPISIATSDNLCLAVGETVTMTAIFNCSASATDTLSLFYATFGVLLVYFLVAWDQLGNALLALSINGGFVVTLLILFNRQLAEQQKATELAETLESANAKLTAYTARIEQLTLQNERQRMARELHDTLAQGVAGLSLQLEAVKMHLKAGRSDRALAIAIDP